MADQVFIPLTVGGGVRRVEDVRKLLNAGADKVSINTAAVEDPELVEKAARRFGSQAIVVAIDARAAARAAGRSTPTAGARRADSTPWNGPRDGRARRGRDPAHQHGSRRHEERLRPRAHARGLEAVTVPVIASGGVGTLEHLAQGIERGRADAVLAASVFHFGEITIPEAKRFLAARGIEMRL